MEYDVFLSHSHDDAGIVEELAKRLTDSPHNFTVFLDKWSLIPGEPWIPAIAKSIGESKTCAVCVGRQTPKGWFHQEIQKALIKQVKDPAFRVIPVLLPGADPGYINDFVELRTWVDLQNGIKDDEGFHNLICGIKGISPGKRSPDKLSNDKEKTNNNSDGRLINVPSLPPHFIKPERAVEEIRDLILADIKKPVLVTGIKAGIYGMGGIGKSVIASAIANSPEVRKEFIDGIIWITIGQNPSLIEQQQILARALGEPSHYGSVGEGKAHLCALLGNKAVLLIFDDLWEVTHIINAFDVLGPRCRAIVTTRDSSLITSIGGTEYRLDLLDDTQARVLLSSWIGSSPIELPYEASELIRECGYLPLALSVCGAMIRTGTSWEDLLDALHDADLKFLKDPQRDVLKCIQVSVYTLDQEEQSRFSELSVFPAVDVIPSEAVQTLWGYSGTIKRRDVRQLLLKLNNRALIRLDQMGQVSIHDLIYDYARMDAGDVNKLHNTICEAYLKKCNAIWSVCPDDGYFYQHICYHLKTADRWNDLKILLTDPRWIRRKIDLELIPSLLADYDLLFNSSNETENIPPELKVLSLIQDAIRLSSHVLSRDRSQLAAQLAGRLVGFDEPVITEFLNEIKMIQLEPWLRPVRPSLTEPGGALIRTLEGHTGLINTINFSCDNLISGSNDNTLKIWDLKTGQCTKTLKAHLNGITSIVISPDGHIGISGSVDKTLIVWDLKLGKYLKILEGHTRKVATVDITIDKCFVISGSDDKTLKKWDLKTGQCIITFEGHSKGITTVSVIPYSFCLVSGSKDKTLKIWDLRSGQCLKTLLGHSGQVNTVVVTPDGNQLISGSKDKTLKIWDLSSGLCDMTLIGHTDKVNTVVVTPDGNQLISGSDDRTLKIWDLRTGQCLRTLMGHTGQVNTVVVTPGGNQLVSGSDDKTLKIWDFKPLKRFEKHIGFIHAVAVCPDGINAVSGYEDGTIKLWDLKTGQLINGFHGHNDWVRAITVTPDGKHIISGSRDNTLKIWELITNRCINTLISHVGLINSIAITPDGKKIISASRDNTLKIWEFKTGRCIDTLEGHNDWVRAVTVTPDGCHAVSGSKDNSVKLWDLKSGKCLKTFLGHTNRINTVAVTPDGYYVVSGSGDKTLKIWDLKSGQCLKTLYGHFSWIRAVAITHDGNHIISGSADKTLKIWDLNSGSLIFSSLYEGQILSCCTSIFGIIIAGDSYGKLLILHPENNPIGLINKDK